MRVHETIMALVAVAVVSAVGEAQQASQAALPTELVAAMLRDQGLDALARSIVVAQLPDSFPAELLVEQRTVLGRVSGPGQVDRSYIITSFMAAAILDSVRRRALATGWAPALPSPADRGFSATTSALASRMYCKGKSTISVAANERSAGGSLLAVTRHFSQGATRCSGPTGQSLLSETERTPPISNLLAPVGAVHQEPTSGTFSTGWVTTARITTPLTINELIAHYSKQLVDSGWTADAQMTSATSAVRTLQRSDSTGRSWQATLTVSFPQRAMAKILQVHAVIVK